MQHQPGKHIKQIVLITTIGFLLIFLESFITTKSITQQDKRLIVFMIMAIVTFILYTVIVLVKYRQFQKENRKYEQKILEETKKKLNSEFKPVSLKSFSAISNELFECQAKVVDGEKIVCRIHLDFETTLNSYEEFTNYFDVDVND